MQLVDGCVIFIFDFKVKFYFDQNEIRKNDIWMHYSDDSNQQWLKVSRKIKILTQSHIMFFFSLLL